MITVDAQVRPAAKQVGEMRQRLDQPRQLMEILAHGLEDYEKRMFATRGEGKWAGNDEETLEQKSGSRVLVDTGRLMRQLTSARILGETVVVDRGSAFYADFHRDGDRGMPRRNPAPKPARRHVEQWAEQLAVYVVTGRTP